MRRLILLLTFLLAATPAFAQTTSTQTGADAVLGDIADIIFNEAERRAIEEYYDKVPGAKREDEDDDDAEKDGKGKKDKKAKGKGKGRGNGLPPGLAKRDQLPPGLAKRGNQLPRGLMKGDLPPELENKLSDLPENVERVTVDNDVLLIEKGTGLILDVLDGVLRNQ